MSVVLLYISTAYLRWLRSDNRLWHQRPGVGVGTKQNVMLNSRNELELKKKVGKTDSDTEPGTIPLNTPSRYTSLLLTL